MTIGKHEKPNKGNTDTWLTPKGLLDQLGEFELDPCCPNIPMPWVTARRMITEENNGLSIPWEGRVFMNPPYSKNILFCKKFSEHKNGIALVFARTETKWFGHFYNADAFLFLKGRLTFCLINGEKAKGNAGAPSVLVAYGDDNVKSLEEYQKNNDGLLLRSKSEKV
jgi:hypothetical protein